MARNPSTSVDRSDIERVVDLRSLFDLARHRYLVLGGGAGMGRQAAHALSQLGASVVVADVDGDLAESVATELGGATTAQQVDATNDEAMAGLAERARELDGVVDVIGMAKYGPMLGASDDDWAWHEGIVLRHAVLTLRHFGPRLRNRGGGSVTFVSSVSGLGSSPVHAAYGAFKAALNSLVRTAAIELGPSGVRVNAVAPGFVLTPRISSLLGDEELNDTVEQIPLRRVTMPADVASALAFLVSDLSRTVTGQVLIVDGGSTTAYPYDMSGF